MSSHFCDGQKCEVCQEARGIFELLECQACGLSFHPFCAMAGDRGGEAVTAGSAFQCGSCRDLLAEGNRNESRPSVRTRETRQGKSMERLGTDGVADQAEGEVRRSKRSQRQVEPELVADKTEEFYQEDVLDESGPSTKPEVRFAEAPADDGAGVAKDENVPSTRGKRGGRGRGVNTASKRGRRAAASSSNVSAPEETYEPPSDVDEESSGDDYTPIAARPSPNTTSKRGRRASTRNAAARDAADDPSADVKQEVDDEDSTPAETGRSTAEATPKRPRRESAAGAGRSQTSSRTPPTSATPAELPQPNDESESGSASRPSQPSRMQDMTRRERNTQLARNRAASFAVGRGFIDDADREREELNEPAPNMPARVTEDGEEVWPGPYSTAYDLWNKRSAAAAARAARTISRKTKLDWKPKGTGSIDKEAIPTLMDLCMEASVEGIEFLAENDLIYPMFPDAKARLSRELCKRRKFDSSVLPFFTEEDTAVLDLPDCNYLNEDDLLAAFDRCKGPMLQEVNLNFCGRAMSDNVLSIMATSSNRIKELRLGGCYRLTDQGIERMLEQLNSLSCLEVSSCTNITRRCLEALVKACADSLRVLSLEAVPQLSGEDLVHLGGLRELLTLRVRENPLLDDESVVELMTKIGKKLEVLDLSSCDEVTDTAVIAAAENCANLREINLDETQVTDAGLVALATKCPALKRVSLRSCSRISDEGCIQLIKKCELRSLCLNGLYGVTDATICALSTQRFSTLEELDMSWCRAVSNEALGILVDNATALRKLNLRGCSQITQYFLKNHSNPNLAVSGHKLVEGIRPEPIATPADFDD